MNTNSFDQPLPNVCETVDRSAPTAQQLSAAREAVSEITGLALRLKELLKADDEAGNTDGLMPSFAPLLIDRIGCFSEMALEFLNGGESYGESLADWLLPTEIYKNLKGGKA